MSKIDNVLSMIINNKAVKENIVKRTRFICNSWLNLFYFDVFDTYLKKQDKFEILPHISAPRSVDLA